MCEERSTFSRGAGRHPWLLSLPSTLVDERGNQMGISGTIGSSALSAGRHDGAECPLGPMRAFWLSRVWESISDLGAGRHPWLWSSPITLQRLLSWWWSALVRRAVGSSALSAGRLDGAESPLAPSRVRQSSRGKGSTFSLGAGRHPWLLSSPATLLVDNGNQTWVSRTLGSSALSAGRHDGAESPLGPGGAFWLSRVRELTSSLGAGRHPWLWSSPTTLQRLLFGRMSALGSGDSGRHSSGLGCISGRPKTDSPPMK